MEKTSIYAKLLEFQKKDISVSKSGKNDHLHSKYATINDVLEVVKKPLSELGIVIVQLPQETGLITRLVSSDDESFVESFFPYAEMGTAQKAGSSNTYARRYALITMLGLEDDDDDGTAAGNIPKKESASTTMADQYTHIEFMVERKDELVSKAGKNYAKLTTNKGSVIAFQNTMNVFEQGMSYSCDVSADPQGKGYIITASKESIIKL